MKQYNFKGFVSETLELINHKEEEEECEPDFFLSLFQTYIMAVKARTTNYLGCWLEQHHVCGDLISNEYDQVKCLIVFN